MEKTKFEVHLELYESNTLPLFLSFLFFLFSRTGWGFFFCSYGLVYTSNPVAVGWRFGSEKQAGIFLFGS